MTEQEIDFMPADQVHALVVQWKKRERRKDERNAELICAIYRSRGGKCKVSDFLPADPDDDKAKKDRNAYVLAMCKAQQAKKQK